MVPESNALLTVVTVWGSGSLFTHTIRSPRCTVSVAGLNCRPSMVTVYCVGRAAGAEKIAAHDPRAPSVASAHAANLIALSACALAQLRLQAPGVIQMRYEGRSHFHQQCLELRVLGAGDQSLIHRLQHRFVIGHLVINVGLVKGGATQLLER